MTPLLSIQLEESTNKIVATTEATVLYLFAGYWLYLCGKMKMLWEVWGWCNYDPNEHLDILSFGVFYYCNGE